MIAALNSPTYAPTSLLTTALMLTGNTNKLTPVAMANPVKNASNNLCTNASTCAVLWKLAPLVLAIFAKIEYSTAGNANCGNRALTLFTAQICANSHTPHTAL